MKELPAAWRAWWERIARAGAPSEAKGVPLNRILPLLLLAGALLMMWSRPGEMDQVAPAGAFLPEAGARDPHSELEARLAELLAAVRGAGRVEVMVVPESTEILVLAEEVTERTSTTSQGGEGAQSEASVTRRPVTVRAEAERREEPVVLYRRRPRVAGVLVVADGARDPAVRRLLLEAVTTLLDVPPHRVSVVPRGG